MSLPFLYANENPHAPVRSNGRRFHGYPSRGVRPDLVVIHDTESVLDTSGADSGAENVARYQSTVVRASSYHRIVDSSSDVLTLPDEAVAFAAKGANVRGLHASLAMQTTAWETSDRETVYRRRRALERLARIVAEWCARYGIPVRILSRRQYLAGDSGIVAHADVDPDRRTDPGRHFPWTTFLELVERHLNPDTPNVRKGPPAMLLVLEPGTPRVMRVEAGVSRHVTEPDERDGYLELGVPLLDRDDEVSVRRRAAILRANPEVTA